MAYPSILFNRFSVREYYYFVNFPTDLYNNKVVGHVLRFFLTQTIIEAIYSSSVIQSYKTKPDPHSKREGNFIPPTASLTNKADVGCEPQRKNKIK